MAEVETQAGDGGGLAATWGPAESASELVRTPATTMPVAPALVPGDAESALPPATANLPAAGDTTDLTEPATGSMGNPVLPPANFRAGYSPFLRSADINQIAFLALPGLAGIIALTALGGYLGYRQAKSGLAVRAAGTARFLS